MDVGKAFGASPEGLPFIAEVTAKIEGALSSERPQPQDPRVTAKKLLDLALTSGIESTAIPAVFDILEAS